MANLLDKAKSIKAKKGRERVFTQEELELFIALAKEEITMNQAVKAMNYEHSGTIYVNIAKAFFQLVQRGVIEFKPFEEGKVINCKVCQNEMILTNDENRDFCSTDCKNDFKTRLKEANKVLVMSFWKQFYNKK